ncbi:MAG: hypothetical protein HOG03_07945 [Desulfobacula sp.]|jgi:hypothetical protein|uniref:hypothetical protein n=1 Tax=Desulfobacula sp. TaxID=2593537 RepID=UPI001D72B1A0|nr:hypothetical protein [Desulfobacula sp.]MBT3485672.1 hypothetical protein [Desulfobacula sp.]MBT3804519.1 hypothetical protein [Desulfobacula sp.]MBT4025822.1 hypothetical protein [Desulfobacula sp.]MBT4199236.1 hypothetical protein [Desulfobacula sp.]
MHRQSDATMTLSIPVFWAMTPDRVDPGKTVSPARLIQPISADVKQKGALVSLNVKNVTTPRKVYLSENRE